MNTSSLADLINHVKRTLSYKAMTRLPVSTPSSTPSPSPCSSSESSRSLPIVSSSATFGVPAVLELLEPEATIGALAADAAAAAAASAAAVAAATMDLEDGTVPFVPVMGGMMGLTSFASTGLEIDADEEVEDVE